MPVKVSSGLYRLDKDLHGKNKHESEDKHETCSYIPLYQIIVYFCRNKIHTSVQYYPALLSPFQYHAPHSQSSSTQPSILTIAISLINTIPLGKHHRHDYQIVLMRDCYHVGYNYLNQLDYQYESIKEG